MKLVFLSGSIDHVGAELIQNFADLLEKKGRLAYIPSCSAGSLPYFENFVRRLKPHGITNIDFFPIDGSKQKVKKLGAYAGVFLSGGNTFYFLKNLVSSGALVHVRALAKKGGVVAGQSAGAIIMTPTIQIAAIPESGDENIVNLKRRASLGLVDFEFFPHFVSRRHARELSRYASTGTSRPVYACDEASGLVIDDATVNFYGNVRAFVAQSSFRLSTSR